MNIELLNKQIISCRFLKSQLNSQPSSNDQFRINQLLLQSVLEHRRINGITSAMDIMKSLSRTKEFCKIDFKKINVLTPNNIKK